MQEELRQNYEQKLHEGLDSDRALYEAMSLLQIRRGDLKNWNKKWGKERNNY